MVDNVTAMVAQAILAHAQLVTLAPTVKLTTHVLTLSVQMEELQLLMETAATALAHLAILVLHARHSQMHVLITHV